MFLLYRFTTYILRGGSQATLCTTHFLFRLDRARALWAFFSGVSIASRYNPDELRPQHPSGDQARALTPSPFFCFVFASLPARLTGRRNSTARKSAGHSCSRCAARAGGSAARPEPTPLAPLPPYDKSAFQNPVPAPALAFLSQYDQAPAATLYHDRRFHHIISANLPNCEFHYGRDMPLSDALDIVISHSQVPVQIRSNRFVLISGQRGPYLGGRGFLWVDMQDGLILGGFYFHPTNGEPTPTLAVFSRQLKTKDKFVAMSQLPPDFILDLTRWSQESGIPPLTTRYFLTGNDKRILLWHTEDYCSPQVDPGLPSAAECEQMNADAADLDMNAAYYLEQVNYATNATAWMIEGQDQVDWLVVRTRTCGLSPDPLACRIRMTRERTRVIVFRNPVPHIPHR
ncbi:MAG TPA: hypothetical protein VHZ09_06215 [Acidobacteriaceae bacterium]|jgi:hypothetical protein|nr:hypothetical protein [Acidobacteriaceae bacterium]